MRRFFHKYSMRKIKQRLFYLRGEVWIPDWLAVQFPSIDKLKIRRSAMIEQCPYRRITIVKPYQNWFVSDKPQMISWSQQPDSWPLPAHNKGNEK